jgi:hypothetical protein
MAAPAVAAPHSRMNKVKNNNNNLRKIAEKTGEISVLQKNDPSVTSWVPLHQLLWNLGRRHPWKKENFLGSENSRSFYQLDTQSFIENLNFAVPQRSTRQNLQYELFGFRTEAGRFTVFNRLMSLFNTYGSDCDLFYDSLATLLKKFKTNLKNHYRASF